MILEVHFSGAITSYKQKNVFPKFLQPSVLRVANSILKETIPKDRLTLEREQKYIYMDDLVNPNDPGEMEFSKPNLFLLPGRYEYTALKKCVEGYNILKIWVESYMYRNNRYVLIIPRFHTTSTLLFSARWVYMVKEDGLIFHKSGQEFFPLESLEWLNYKREKRLWNKRLKDYRSKQAKA